MLEELEIRSLGPIDHAVLHPHAGMTAITGETGAGKSMLLSAVQLLSGAGTQSEWVSPGAEQAWVQGIFDVSENGPVQDFARQAGAGCEDSELFISRSVPSAGRSRSVVNGKSVPRSVLQGLGTYTVTVHGQAEQLKLASASRQREFLDRCARNGSELDQYQQAYAAVKEADGQLERIIQQQSQAQAQADYLRESIGRIDSVDPQKGEDEELKARRTRIENAADIATAVSSALEALDTSEADTGMGGAGAADRIDRAVRTLESSSAREVFKDEAQRLTSLHEDLQDIIFSLAHQIPDDVSPQELDDINGRIHDLDELTKRWGPTLDDVLAWREKAGYDLEDLDASPERIEELRARREALRAEAHKKAEALSRKRSECAQELSSRVNEELGSLAMEGSRLDITVERKAQPDGWGEDTISFFFTPFPGSPQLPMGKSASGGELSRLMLALELVAFDMQRGGHKQGDGVPAVTAGGTAPTLIFDEIDAGVGGKSAVELGKRLARLAKGSQVIVVTHLAQVASWADIQYVVRKGGQQDGPDMAVHTDVTEASGHARVEEIARMLSGTDTQASLDHARELLETSVLE